MAVAPVRVRFVSDGGRDVLHAFDSLEKRARDVANVQIREAQRSATASNQAARRASAHGAGPYRGRSVADDETRLARAKEKQASRMDKIRERSALMAGKYAKQAADAEIREANRAARETAKAAALASKQRRQTIMSAGGAIARAGRGTLSTVGGLAAGVGATAGTYAIGSAVMSAMSLEEKAALLANNASMGGIAPDQNKLMADARGVATTTGYKAEDVMDAMSTVAAKAEGGVGLAAFTKDLDDVARTAKAAGVSMEDMGSVYAAAFKAGVKPGEEMQQLMRDLVQQGKSGSIEFSDLASELARLGGAGRKFGNGADMLRKVSGWAQLAVESKVSKEESRTAVVDMLREFTQSEKIVGMKQLGVTVTKGNKLNDPAEIMADMISGIESGKKFGGTRGGKKYGGKDDASKLGAYGYMFTGASNDLALGLRDTFLGAGGGDAGKKAVLERIRSAEGKSGTFSESARDKDYERVMGTTKAKVDQSIEKFKAEISLLLPEFAKLLPDILRLSQGFAKLAVWVSKNPFEGLGVLFGAKLAAEVGKAAIPGIMERGLKAAMEATLTGGVWNVKNMQALGAIALAATAVYIGGTNIMDDVDKEGGKAGEERFAAFIKGGNLLSRIKAQGGKATEEQRVEAKGLIGGIDKKTSIGSSYVGGVGGDVVDTLLSADITGAGMMLKVLYNSAEKSSASLAGNAEEATRMKAALAAVAEAGDKAAASLNSVGGGGTDKNKPPRNTPISNR
jgi:hypothetical protein